MGGSDQWGNITMGTELVRKVTGRSAAGLTSPLLLRADGQKFGKSEAGNDRVWLDATLTSPFALHQFLLNADDATTPGLLRFFTFLDHDTIEELDAATLRVPQERRAQRAAANEIVALVHGRDAAIAAERAGEALFGESIADLDEATLLEVVADAGRQLGKVVLGVVARHDDAADAGRDRPQDQFDLGLGRDHARFVLQPVARPDLDDLDVRQHTVPLLTA